jgi:hypothetical protein
MVMMMMTMNEASGLSSRARRRRGEVACGGVVRALASRDE